MLVGSIACSCGRHITWRCECGAVAYGPARSAKCSLLDGQARVRRMVPATPMGGLAVGAAHGWSNSRVESRTTADVRG
ncbi:MAG: hypothetical protein QOE30_6225 [Mycobacterium sp.]|nr:hypothetical protein [Mycobacterium sp.]